MTHLIKISPPIWPIFAYEFSIIKSLIEKKKRVIIWICSGDKTKINFCHANPNMQKIVCLACKSKLKNSLNKLKGKYDIINDFDDSQKLKKEFKIFYKKQKKIPIEKIKYDNIDLGKGVQSTLFTLFKSKYSKSNTKFISLKLLEESFYILKKIQNIVSHQNIRKTLIFNGRHYNYRPILRYLSQKNHWVESYDISNYSNKLIFSKNDYPHNLIERSKKVFKIKKIKSKKFLKNQGVKFFKKRFSENTSNNLIDNYEFSQNNSLPERFDKTKFNIMFFNTSLWEFKSIVENKNFYLFKDDFEFINFLYKKYHKNKDVFFYFRCHPNMIGEQNYLIKIKNRTSKFKNLLFINPEDKINSKLLLANSDLVINFGSSIALEGAFLGKKIITLAPSIFSKFKFQNIFTTKKKLTNFIEYVLKIKLKNKLVFDKRVYEDALIAAGAASCEGVSFNSVIILDRFKQIYVNKKKYINLAPSLFVNILFNFLITVKVIKKLIYFTFLDYNLTISKIKIFRKRIKNIYGI